MFLLLSWDPIIPALGWNISSESISHHEANHCGLSQKNIILSSTQHFAMMYNSMILPQKHT